MAYATIASSPATADALGRAGWRWLLTPDAVDRNRPAAASACGLGYALDNGAWGAHRAGAPWDAGRFQSLVDEFGAGADWVAAPDIVAGGLASLRLSESWLPRLHAAAPMTLVPVQDGMVPADIDDIIGPQVGVFLGGSTSWKLATMRQWGAACANAGAHYHVARVNTVRRIAACVRAGADSFDGTSVIRFPSTLGKLDAARGLMALPLEAA